MKSRPNLEQIKILVIDQELKSEDLFIKNGLDFCDFVSREIDAKVLIKKKNHYDFIVIFSFSNAKTIDFLNFCKKVFAIEKSVKTNYS